MKYYRVLLVILLTFLISGCGIFGETYPFTLNLTPPHGKIANVIVKSVTIEDPSLFSKNANVHNSRDVIEKSLISTLNKAQEINPPSLDKTLELQLVIRRFLTYTTNSGGAALACVVWRLADKDGNTIYEEQFYVTSEGYLVVTAGMMLHGINSKIVSRVIETTLKISTLEQVEKRFKGKDTKDTSVNFEDAIKSLPEHMNGSNYSLTPNWVKAYCPDKCNWDVM